ncbi:MAG: STAS domain-containing protein [Acidimicrobiales bacterium]
MVQNGSSYLVVSSRSADERTAGDADHVVVWLRGEHDIATAAQVSETLARATKAGGPAVVVDLSGVTFLSAATIGAIVASREALRIEGRSLVVRAPSPSAERILMLCRLSHLLRSPHVPEATRTRDAAEALHSWVPVHTSPPPEGALDPSASGEVIRRTVSSDSVGPRAF